MLWLLKGSRGKTKLAECSDQGGSGEAKAMDASSRCSDRQVDFQFSIYLILSSQGSSSPSESCPREEEDRLR